MSRIAEKIWAVTGTGSDESMIYDKWEKKVDAILESDLRLERAIAMREAAKHQQHHMFSVHAGGITQSSCACGEQFPVQGSCQAWSKHILALSDQPALDRHDAELRAQTAAMLEIAAKRSLLNGLVDTAKTNHGDMAINQIAYMIEQHIRALIPTDYAAALNTYVAERVREAREDEFRDAIVMCTTFPLEQMKVLIKNRAKELAAHRAAAESPEE